VHPHHFVGFDRTHWSGRSQTGSSAVIVGSIVMKVYPVRANTYAARRPVLAELGNQLDRWYIGLPEGLRYDVHAKLVIPPPHILLLHISYWGAVLLLHRAL
jgi:hypothetical protein